MNASNFKTPFQTSFTTIADGAMFIGVALVMVVGTIVTLASSHGSTPDQASASTAQTRAVAKS